MTIPILTAYPLFEEKAILGMCCQGEVELKAEVRSYPNDEDAMPSLRDPIVRRVQQLIYDVVGKPGMTSSRRQLLQPSKMVNPFLISPSPHLRKRELVNDVAVIIAEILSKQTLHILKNERLRSDLADWRTACGNIFRLSCCPRCLPPRENGWQGGPPATNCTLPECCVKS